MSASDFSALGFRLRTSDLKQVNYNAINYYDYP